MWQIPDSIRWASSSAFGTFSEEIAAEQPVVGVAGDLDRLVLAVDGDDRGERPERLLRVDPHPVGHTEQNSRLETRPWVPPPANPRAVRLRVGDVGTDALERLVVEWRDLCLGIARVADPEVAARA